MRTAGIGYASYFFTLQRIRKKLPVAGSVGAEAHLNELLFVGEYNIIV